MKGAQMNQIEVLGIVASEEVQTHKNSTKGFTLVKTLEAGWKTQHILELAQQYI